MYHPNYLVRCPKCKSDDLDEIGRNDYLRSKNSYRKIHDVLTTELGEFT